MSQVYHNFSPVLEIVDNILEETNDNIVLAFQLLKEGEEDWGLARQNIGDNLSYIESKREEKDKDG